MDDLKNLVLTVHPGQKVNLYQRTEHGPKLLGAVTVMKKKDRLAFEFTDDVLVLRGELEQPTGAK
jgi:hypothetical protein